MTQHTETCLHCYVADRAEGTVYCAKCLKMYQSEAHTITTAAHLAQQILAWMKTADKERGKVSESEEVLIMQGLLEDIRDLCERSKE